MSHAVAFECVGAALFTDLVGFTEFTESVGDVAALQLLDTQTAMARSVVDGKADARIVKELGDGLLLWFATAADGLDCATELLNDFGDARRAGRFSLPVRMGMHYGPAIARGDDLVGQNINIAARLSDIAGPDELLVSEALVEAIGTSGPPDLSPVGPVRVKGVSEPLWVHRLSAMTVA